MDVLLRKFPMEVNPRRVVITLAPCRGRCFIMNSRRVALKDCGENLPCKSSIMELLTLSSLVGADVSF